MNDEASEKDEVNDEMSDEIRDGMLADAMLSNEMKC